MKHLAFLISTIIMALPILNSGQEVNQKTLAVTIYNSNLGVVKDLREIKLNSGLSEIRITDVAQLIDPTSVHIKLMVKFWNKTINMI